MVSGGGKRNPLPLPLPLPPHPLILLSSPACYRAHQPTCYGAAAAPDFATVAQGGGERGRDRKTERQRKSLLLLVHTFLLPPPSSSGLFDRQEEEVSESRHVGCARAAGGDAQHG